MDLSLVIAGALFMVWPIQYRWSIGRVHDRVAARGGDAEAFDRRMDRPWIRAGLVIAPVCGLLLVVLGLLG